MFKVSRFAGLAVMTLAFTAPMCATDQVKVEGGIIEGTTGDEPTVRIFRGVPFAAPPVGDLRWKAPQPLKPWTEVRKATEFGARCSQTSVYSDMVFRDSGPSEDCLYLNVWTPAKSASERLPVIVWFYLCGFVSGSSSEARYDGVHLAAKGAVVVTPNYRLGVFGFMAHPELTKESGHNASGNYALLDLVAALQWVHINVGAFGGDPNNVTISGESAGSFAVSALMASPLAQGLFHKAIGESGAFFPNDRPSLAAKSLNVTERAGMDFAASLHAASLAALRAKTAAEILQAAADDSFRFAPNLDGYFLPGKVPDIYAAGKQSHVPLLAGWNADEGKGNILYAKEKTTAKSFVKKAQDRWGNRADSFLSLYPAATDEQALESAEELAGDDFIAFSTWKWLNSQVKTGQAPVYAYLFEQVPAEYPGAMSDGLPAVARGARHSGEIEYVFQMLKWLDRPWTPEDFQVADTMSSFWVNFARSGDPNGKGLPQWPKYESSDRFQVMHFLGTSSHSAPEEHRARYEFLQTAK
jgi:para-nitrobenzyl esterase